MKRKIRKGVILFAIDNYHYQLGNIHFYLVTKTKNGRAYFVELEKKRINNEINWHLEDMYMPVFNTVISGERSRKILKNKVSAINESTKTIDLLESPTAYHMEAKIWNKNIIK